MATDQGVSVLIVVRPGALQEGLRALLATIPRITLVGEVRDSLSVPGIAATYRPALVVLEASVLEGVAGSLLEQIRRGSPDTRHIILARDVHQQQEVSAAGADAVLLEGALAAQLVATVEGLLSERAL